MCGIFDRRDVPPPTVSLRSHRERPDIPSNQATRPSIASPLQAHRLQKCRAITSLESPLAVFGERVRRRSRLLDPQSGRLPSEHAAIAKTKPPLSSSREFDAVDNSDESAALQVRRSASSSARPRGNVAMRFPPVRGVCGSNPPGPRRMCTPSLRRVSTLRRNANRLASTELTNGRTTMGACIPVISARMARAQVSLMPRAYLLIVSYVAGQR
jgi:hypothetical protein